VAAIVKFLAETDKMRFDCAFYMSADGFRTARRIRNDQYNRQRHPIIGRKVCDERRRLLQSELSRNLQEAGLILSSLASVLEEYDQ